MTASSALRPLMTLVLGLAVVAVIAGCELEDFALDRLSVNASMHVAMEEPDASETATLDVPYSGQRFVVVNPLGQIRIETVADPGYVAVRPTIHVEATKNVKGMALDDLMIETEQTADETRIRVTTDIRSARDTEDEPSNSDGPVGWVDFAIRIPQDAVVTLRQRVGAIRVQRFHGELTATTDLGEIEVEDATTPQMYLRSEVGRMSVARSTVGGVLNVETTAGEIELLDVGFGQATIDTQAGEVSAKGIRGQSLDISTQLGEIDVTDADVGRLDLASQMGEITLRSSRVDAGDLSTQWGEIAVQVRLNAVPRIRASTQAGAVDVYRLPEELRPALRRGGSWLGESVELTPNDAQGTLDLDTQLGDIQIVFPRTSSL